MKAYFMLNTYRGTIISKILITYNKILFIS